MESGRKGRLYDARDWVQRLCWGIDVDQAINIDIGD